MISNSKERSKRGASRRQRQVPKAASARQKYERYLALARAEDESGDPVAAENYYQHAEHYFRASNAAGNDISTR